MLMNSRTTTNKSSSGSNSVLRNSTTMVSCPGDNVVDSLWGR